MGQTFCRQNLSVHLHLSGHLNSGRHRTLTNVQRRHDCRQHNRRENHAAVRERFAGCCDPQLGRASPKVLRRSDEWRGAPGGVNRPGQGSHQPGILVIRYWQSTALPRVTPLTAFLGNRSDGSTLRRSSATTALAWFRNAGTFPLLITLVVQRNSYSRGGFHFEVGRSRSLALDL